MRTIVAIPSDTHCGSTIGLCPPKQVQLDDGGYYNPSRGQKEVLWKMWEQGWDRVRELRKKSRLIIVHNGDSVEGTHDHVMGVVSRRRETQERIHIDCMDWAFRKSKFKNDDLLYYMRGTKWHVGRGAESDERIAEDLDAIPSEASFSHYHLRLDVDGVLLDIAHHGVNAGTRAWTKENALYHTIKSIYFDNVERNQPVPRAWIRSHYHVWVDPPTYKGNHGKITGFITPSFQLITPFGIKVGKAIKLASIGLLILIIENGELDWECHQVEYQHAPIIRV